MADSGTQPGETAAQARLLRELAEQYSVTCKADLADGALGRGLFAQQVAIADRL
jgi:hypothetical protein